MEQAILTVVLSNMVAISVIAAGFVLTGMVMVAGTIYFRAKQLGKL